MVSFLQVSPPEPCAHLSPPPYGPHAPPISTTTTTIIIIIILLLLLLLLFLFSLIL
jgi:hypothetical protein